MTILDELFKLNLNLSELMLDMTPYTSEYNYNCTPLGALPFASMGCDGVHYCIIPQEGDETLENSPIYSISPMDFSDGTILWTAKNFTDFISITAILKDAWALPALVYMQEDEFVDYLEDIELEYEARDSKEKRDLKKELEILTKTFPTIEICNLFQYIKASYLNINNHAKVKFSDLEIKEIELGHYAYGD